MNRSIDWIKNNTSKELQDRLFNNVKKAHFAYHTNHLEPHSHKYYSDSDTSRCQWCGRSRLEVRYDSKNLLVLKGLIIIHMD